MKDAGAESTRFKVVVPGAFCEYTGRKNPGAGSTPA
jgi:hypothetical protein